MNVYDASLDRLKFLFDNFEYVYVSFSGGKDSGVLLNLTADYVRNNCPNRKFGIFHIDYEAQYQMTTDYVDAELEKYKDVADIYRVCLPMSVSCATSMHSSHWIPWDIDKKHLWVRELPSNAISEQNNPFDWFIKGMWDYDLQVRFAEWIHQEKGFKSTCCLVGIRTQESLNRWRAIHSDKNKNKFKGKNYTLKMSNGVVNAYPIFDWKADDVWICNAKNNYSYNALYDLFYKAGVSVDQMRVASPFNDCAIESLKLYKVIDPKNWGKMIGRVNGVNFAGLYGGTTAMGWRNIKLPNGHTWKSYMEFLLTTLPESAAESYKKKLQFSQDFWRNKGGCLSTDVQKKLMDLDVKFDTGLKTLRKTNKTPITLEYLDDIDIEEFSLIPSYKRMCICIMKNDHLCKYMGFSLSKTETQLRSESERKYSNLLLKVKNG